jgi:hypothetical protein
MTAKQKLAQKAVLLRIDDLKIQMDGLLERIRPYDEDLYPLIPVIKSFQNDIAALNADLMKSRAEIIMLKGDVDRLNENQAQSAVDMMNGLRDMPGVGPPPAIIDIEKPMTAMRQQLLQQFAKLEAAFNEKLRKIRAEISALRAQQAGDGADRPPSPPPDDDVSVVSELMKEEPAEKQVLADLQKKAEEDRVRQQEQLAKMRQDSREAAAQAAAKSHVDKASRLQKITKALKKEDARPKPTIEFAEAEVQTAESGLASTCDVFTSAAHLPASICVAVLVDSPPVPPAKPPMDISDEVCIIAGEVWAPQKDDNGVQTDPMAHTPPRTPTPGEPDAPIGPEGTRSPC